MRRPAFACLLTVGLFSFIVAQATAHDPSKESVKRSRFNQVFVKVVVPVTKHTPDQEGPVIESWIAARLKKLDGSDFFAVTDWVPVCDGLLTDEDVDNDVWDGCLKTKYRFCPVDGDIPERENGRAQLLLRGWDPGGSEVTVSLKDEPGSRAVACVEECRVTGVVPYVAVIVGPPPVKASTRKHFDAK